MTDTKANNPVPNTEFIEVYLASDSASIYVLPHERVEAISAMDQQEAQLREIVQAKVDVTGGDDWHDGAFRATDNEANIMRERMRTVAPFVTATVVDYPLPDETRVTLGSRVRIAQNGFEFPVDIISYKFTKDETIDISTGEEVMSATLSSPLAKALFGKLVDTQVEYKLGDRLISATILTLDQNAVRDQFYAS